MPMKRPFAALVLALFAVAPTAGGGFAAEGQAGDSKLQANLKKLFPTATSFSPKTGTPPHFTALLGDPKVAASQTPAGFAFWTTELEPLERGYDGPIKILVGMDMKGVLTGIVVVEHHEPYGNF